MTMEGLRHRVFGVFKGACVCEQAGLRTDIFKFARVA